jgi:Leucine-rich repeat (LRR) protein
MHVLNSQALTSLEVAGNQLETLPEEIASLSALQKLAAFGNCLKTLPGGVGGLTSVREVWLQGNQLTALPAAIGQLTVRLGYLWTIMATDYICTFTVACSHFCNGTGRQCAIHPAMCPLLISSMSAC